MTAPPPRRPWRKKKRTWVALAVLPLATYPAMLGPVIYARDRGGVSSETQAVYRRPYGAALDSLPDWATAPVRVYVGWWVKRGQRERMDEWMDAENARLDETLRAQKAAKQERAASD